MALDPKGLQAKLAIWFNALPDGGMGKEHFDALLAIVHQHAGEGEAEPVAWRVRERPGFDWRLTTGDPERDPRFRGQESQPLYAAPPSPQVEITEAMVEAAWRVLDGLAVVTHDDVRNVLTAALSPTGRDAE